MDIYLKKLLHKNNLCRQEMYELFGQFAQAPLEQQAALAALFATKEPTVAELLGARDFLIAQSTCFSVPYEVIDIVGTGGDGTGTFNISTAASLVIASCGVYVAKHGGKRSTSQSGSTDVLKCLGLSFQQQPEQVILQLNKHRYTYLCAPFFNPALKQYASLRKNLGFPTLFNLMGPLLNPTQPKRQVIGVYCPDLLPVVAATLKILGTKHALVVHSADGLDELSISAPTYIAEVKDDTIKQYMMTPQVAGLSLSPLSEVIGGTPEENAHLIRGILSGKITGPKLDIVLLNSAAGLLVAGATTTWQEGVLMAQKAINTGKTAALLNEIQGKLL